MPCYTIKKTTVNVSKMDVPTLVQGLEAAGVDVRLDDTTIIFSERGSYLYHNYHNGVLTFAGANVEDLTQQVKRAYSTQVVKRAASQFGWGVKQKTVNSFVATKRS